MRRVAAIKLILATPIFMLAAYYLTTLAQEYAHAITASLLDYKNHTHDLAVITFSRLCVASGGLYLASELLMRLKFMQRLPMIFYFLFWLNFMSIAQFFSFIFVRDFTEQGDIANLILGTDIQPWAFSFSLCLIAGYMIYHFFATTLSRAYQTLQIDTMPLQMMIILCCTIPLFTYIGTTGLLDDYETARLLAALSLILLPIVITLCWPLSTIQTAAEAQHNETIDDSDIEPRLSPSLIRMHQADTIDEDHFMETVNAVLHQRDIKLRDSRRQLQHTLTRNRID